jgi:hypothetical protein
MSVEATGLTATEMVTRLEESRQRGADWIVSRIDDDGKPVGAEHTNLYYRVPWALQVAGRSPEAARVLTWIEDNALTPEGDVREGAPRRNFNAPLGWTADAASYPIAIIAYGAWLLERYDTANAMMDTLVAFQDQETGGGFAERPEAEYRTTGRQELLNTSQIGLTALLTGRREMADLAFRWLENLWDNQTALPNRLQLSTDSRGNVLTEAPEGQEFGHFLDVDKPRQAFFMPGLGAAFAGRYAMATGNRKAIEIGRGLLDVSERAHESQYDHTDTVHVGKFAWGAGVMADADPGTESHVADALRMGQWFLDSQEEDGRWNPSRFLVPDPQDHDALWKTGEHIVLMNVVIMALAGRPRTAFAK